MNTPAPSPAPGAAPSGSTVGTAAGGLATTIVVWLLGLKGVTVPPEVAAALTAVFGVLAGYLPKSGRK